MSLNISKEGDLVWRNEKGQWHRDKGPAIICSNGYKAYWFNNFLHRLDGPAEIYPDGRKYYWIDGDRYSKENYYAKVKKLWV